MQDSRKLATLRGVDFPHHHLRRRCTWRGGWWPATKQHSVTSIFHATTCGAAAHGVAVGGMQASKLLSLAWCSGASTSTGWGDPSALMVAFVTFSGPRCTSTTPVPI
ncbi:hypothetical protein SETIT_4G228100v2 [Setaria italica]|uniref:Uncharacterized protein n=1 Tax=Setaria italica TaxID=4555 RepID=A0A368QXI3_SETIT|nr:hypothetical protein SETIT_4G228100v2 [Setaria italica]